MTRLLTLSAILLTWAACTNDSNDMVPLDLFAQGGLPITIMAPDSARVTQGIDLPGTKEVIITAGDDYGVQVTQSPRSSGTVASLVEDAKATVRGGEFFKEIVQEYEDGFVFSTSINDNPEDDSYDFRRIRLKGDYVYEFGTQFGEQYSQAQAEQMYESVAAAAE